ncbi:MAG TPA: helix-turn-helix domain-containing protein [Nitrospira sp.]|nr:helix-turn-helix domain-containing protein [Candidatus Manganitrophaceae bacterium]
MSSKKKRRSSMKSAKAAGPSSNGSSEPQQSQTPSPEVLEKPTRRRFTAEYKARIVQLAESLPHGEQAALLRKEGLYASHLRDWRKLYKNGGIDALKTRKRGPTTKPDAKWKKHSEQLERENARLRHRLDQARKLVCTIWSPSIGSLHNGHDFGSP